VTFPILLIIVGAILLYGGIKGFSITDLFFGKTTPKDTSGEIGTSTANPASIGSSGFPFGGSPWSVSGTQLQLLQNAKKYLGIPYMYGGNDPKIGIDCSRFVQLAFASVGISLGRDTYSQYAQGTPVDIQNIQPGDVIFTEPSFKGPGHEGLYIGNGEVQESPHHDTVNQVIPLQNFIGNPHNLVGVRRYL
jgi:peptidoglycan DL-endopeptidase CwlO